MILWNAIKKHHFDKVLLVNFVYIYIYFFHDFNFKDYSYSKINYLD